MSADMWRCVSDLAERWRELPSVQATAAELPRGGRPGPSDLSKLINELRVFGGMRVYPLRLWHEANIGLSMDFTQHLHRPPTLERWLVSAQAVEMAFREQLAWVRAQLPGYPLLRVPHLVDNTAYTTRGFTWKAAWLKEHHGRGYQYKSAPLVQVEETVTDMSRELNTLIQAMKQTDPWLRFEQNQAALTDDDRKELSSASQQLRNAMRPVAIDALAIEHVSELDTYQKVQMEECLQPLGERATAYVRAFEVVADLIEFALDGVLAQLVAFGLPEDIGVVADIDFIGDDEVELTPQEFVFDVGGLKWIPDPLVNEVGHIRSTHVNERNGTTVERLGIRLIPGAAVGWGLTS
jgi:hypothetical protein